MRARHALAALLLVAACITRQAGAQSQPFTAYLPLVKYRSATPNRLAIDLRTSAPDAAVPFLQDSGTALVRAGDVDWSWVESQPGVYQWQELAAFESNVRRIRAAGLEPTAVLMRTPLWASAVAGRMCAAPRDDAIDDLERFAEAAAARYAQGDLAVHVWQIGNEVDFQPDQITDPLGSGCWANAEAPFYGGDRYGAALRRIAAAVRRGNPRAEILAAGLAHPWPDDAQTLGFVRGMLAAGAAPAFDALSYSGYGNWGVNDKMILKAAHLRAVLAEFGLAGKPLVAAEVGQTCVETPCPVDFAAIQSEYAAHIYAEAIAWDLDSIAWFTLLPAGGDPNGHRLLEVGEQTLSARPAFYALRNSVALLRDARSAAAPALPPDDAAGAQVLSFLTPRGSMYVVWDPRRAGTTTWLAVAPGMRATCIQHLEWPTPQSYDCSGQIHDGLLSISTSSTVYVEVVAP
jgi:hypothetical protein